MTKEEKHLANLVLLRMAGYAECDVEPGGVYFWVRHSSGDFLTWDKLNPTRFLHKSASNDNSPDSWKPLSQLPAIAAAAFLQHIEQQEANGKKTTP